jgi:hypothetical protein
MPRPLEKSVWLAAIVECRFDGSVLVTARGHLTTPPSVPSLPLPLAALSGPSVIFEKRSRSHEARWQWVVHDEQRWVAEMERLKNGGIARRHIKIIAEGQEHFRTPNGGPRLIRQVSCMKPRFTP